MERGAAGTAGYRAREQRRQKPLGSVIKNVLDVWEERERSDG